MRKEIVIGILLSLLTINFCSAASLGSSYEKICGSAVNSGTGFELYINKDSVVTNGEYVRAKYAEKTVTKDKEDCYCFFTVQYDVHNKNKRISDIKWLYDDLTLRDKQLKEDISASTTADIVNSGIRGAAAIVGGIFGLALGNPDMAGGLVMKSSEIPDVMSFQAAKVSEIVKDTDLPKNKDISGVRTGNMVSQDLASADKQVYDFTLDLTEKFLLKEMSNQNLDKSISIGEQLIKIFADNYNYREKLSSMYELKAQYGRAIRESVVAGRLKYGLLTGGGVKKEVLAFDELENVENPTAMNLQIVKESIRSVFSNGDEWITAGRNYLKENKYKKVAKCYEEAANLDNAEGQYNWANCLLCGNGVKRDEAKAVVWLEKASKDGNIEAKFTLAECYKNGKGTDMALKKAFDLYVDVANTGHANAMYALGECYEDGLGTNRDLNIAVEWYKKAFDNGIEKASEKLDYAKWYDEGLSLYDNSNYTKAIGVLELSALHGNLDAQNKLTELYSSDEKFGISYDKAFNFCQMAANQGNASAEYKLAQFYLDGMGVKKDTSKYFEWLTKAAYQGMVEAQYDLAKCYYDGVGTEVNHELAVKWFEVPASQEYRDADRVLGFCYYKGDGTAVDYSKAMRLLKRYAENGDNEIQLLTGTSYLHGKGVSKSYPEAYYWFVKSSEQGNKEACYYTGLCLENGYGCDVNYEKAFQYYCDSFGTVEKEQYEVRMKPEYWFDKGVVLYSEKVYDNAVVCWQIASRMGYADAQYNLALCYLNGVGIGLDSSEAVNWFAAAAKQNNYKAENELGKCYYNGVGTKQDFVIAYQCFEKAANAGDTDAKYNLGLCFFDGKGAEKNFEKAFNLYCNAAEEGHVEAKYCVGLCYEYGWGTEKNITAAKNYYDKAAQCGNVKAQNKLRGLVAK